VADDADRGGALLERGEELRRIAELLSQVADGRGGLLAVEGPAGIGKTVLLDAAAEEGRARGVRALRAAGSELEREFAFGIARRLLEETLVRADPARRAALLDGAAGLAAPALGLAGPAGGAGADEAGFASLHGLYWLTANLASDGPLLLVVDDLQWADAPSLRYLAYLARRLSGAPIGVVVGLRPALPGEGRAAIEAMLAPPAPAPLRPAALSEGAVATLGERLLGAPLDAALARACHRATGGNALLAREVLAELRERGGPPDPAGVERFGADRLGAAVRRRIAALPGRAGALAAAVAMLGDGCAAATAAALAGLADDEAVGAAASLVAADVLADGLPLRFRHPVVRAAVAEAMPAVERAAAHLRAARLVDAAGAPPAAVAAHLRLAPPTGDPWAVERLRAAAREARAQGAADAAAADLGRALAEPPRAELRGDVLHELGLAELAAALPAAFERLRAALALEVDPVRRGRIALHLASGLYDRMRAAEAAEVARAALADLGGADADLALTLEVLVAECVRMDLGVGGDEPERLRARAAALPGDTPAQRYAIAFASMMGGADSADDHAAVAEALERILALGPLPPGSPDTGIVSNLLRASRLETAGGLIEAKLAEARAGGLVQRYALMVGMRGWLELEAGDLSGAEADLGASLELAAELAIPAGPFAGMLALVLAEQGRLAEADELLDSAGLAGVLPEHQVMNVLMFARSRVRLAQGRRDEALADALEVGRRYERWGIRRAVPPWRSLAAVQLAGRGEVERARALAYEELGLAERWGTPLALGLAWRGIGLVIGDVSALEAAADQLERSPNRLEHARALVDLGAALRRAGRRADARAPLGRGMDVAHACGAAPLAERAREELRAAGARPRRLALTGAQALTASERRVAGLAARGLSNRRIAEELFVTTATVETHLRHAFRKLGIGSRDELAGALASGEGGGKIRVPQ
jgi:DNA-binding CsgD family transcriptional regulator